MRASYRDLLIALFAIGIVLGLVFGGGVVLGRNSAPPVTPIAAAGGAGAAAGGGAGASAAGGGGASGAGGGAAAQNVLAGQTVGTITAVEGDGFTLRGLDGRTLTMAESLSTRVTNSVPGTVSDVRPGSLVSISPGPPDAQGRTIATTILILPANLAAAAQGGAASSGAGSASGARPSGTPTAAAGGASATPTR